MLLFYNTEPDIYYYYMPHRYAVYCNIKGSKGGRQDADSSKKNTLNE